MVISTSLIFIICMLTSGLCCNWLTDNSKLRNTTMVLIEVMGGEFTKQDCLVLFPYKMYKRVEKREVESQLGFIRDSLKEIFHLYRYDNLSSTSWDPVKTMLFLESINRQIYELNSCVSKYFLLYAFWELLRKKTKHHLVSLDILGNKLQRSIG
uniref:Uncharacterized protein n=1 Tax=Nothobranchius furzeri TaxID=105023 RepID=A0A8C6MK42_NOTFU